jgi:hypothetical protein
MVGIKQVMQVSTLYPRRSGVDVRQEDRRLILASMVEGLKKAKQAKMVEA